MERSRPSKVEAQTVKLNLSTVRNFLWSKTQYKKIWKIYTYQSLKRELNHIRNLNSAKTTKLNIEKAMMTK